MMIHFTILIFVKLQAPELLYRYVPNDFGCDNKIE